VDRIIWAADRQAAWRDSMDIKFFLEDDCEPARWRPSIYMPRWASRITLEITSVRVERLGDISEDDARAEGVAPVPFCKAGRRDGLEHVEAFENLWDRINGKRASWASNPWVWVVAFQRAAASVHPGGEQ
jgi:hypothetical protein